MMEDSEFVGGYDYDFSSVPDDLICQICHCVAKNAHQVDCCGKIYCKACIERTRRKRAYCYHDVVPVTCPNCRAKARPFRDQRSERQIKLLKLSCENEHAGCSWTGELAKYEIHKDKCEFSPVTCPNQCGTKLQRNEFKRHLSRQCPKRTRSCRLCKALVEHAEMAKHQNEECPKVKVVCPNACSRKKMFRDKLLLHRLICKKEIVSCSFADAGCFVKIAREELKTHLEESKDEHLALASSTVAELKRKLSVTELTPVPVTVKVPSFSMLKANNGKWESPVFSYPLKQNPSYPWEQLKVCLEVYPNGIPPCQGTHLSVVLKVDAHEDCHPYHEYIAVSLLSQLSDLQDKHVTRTIPMNLRPGYNISCSCSAFMSHEDLQQQGMARKYLRNDCAYFRVFKECATKPWLQCTFEENDEHNSDFSELSDDVYSWSFDSDLSESSSFFELSDEEGSFSDYY